MNSSLRGFVRDSEPVRGGLPGLSAAHGASLSGAHTAGRRGRRGLAPSGAAPRRTCPGAERHPRQPEDTRIGCRPARSGDSVSEQLVDEAPPRRETEDVRAGLAEDPPVAALAEERRRPRGRPPRRRPAAPRPRRRRAACPRGALRRLRRQDERRIREHGVVERDRPRRGEDRDAAARGSRPRSRRSSA